MEKDSLPLTVRPAETTDMAMLVALLRQLFAIEEDFRIDEDRQRRGLAMLLENPQALILVAEAAGRVIGMCSGQLLVSTAEGGPAFLMEDVVVAESFRGRGAGRLLVSAMADWAATRGAFRLQLLADRDNSRALSFYQAIGWQTTKLICLRRYQEPRNSQPY
jgi:ribosomal protein S18 acetylase RimI-like enzyme